MASVIRSLLAMQKEYLIEQGDAVIAVKDSIDLIERARRKRIDLYRVDVAIAGRLHPGRGIGFLNAFARIARLRLRARAMQRLKLAGKRLQFWQFDDWPACDAGRTLGRSWSGAGGAPDHEVSPAYCWRKARAC
jgi:hypothetical protein